MPPAGNAALKAIRSEGPFDDAKQALLCGEWTNARRILNAALEAEPENAEASHLLGLALSGAGDYHSAICWLEKSLAAPAAPWTWKRNLGELYCIVGDWQRGAALFAELLASSPEDSALLLRYGEAVLEVGDPTEAIRSFQSAHQLAPETWEAVNGLARAFAAAGQYDEAIQAVDSFARLHLLNSRAWLLLGEILIFRREYDQARGVFESFLGRDPANQIAQEMLTRVYWELGRVDLALDCARPRADAICRPVAVDSFYTYLHLFQPDQDGYSLKQVCEDFAARIQSPEGPRSFSPSPGEPERRLRVGYLTGDLVAGSPFFFLSSLIGNHDRKELEIYCYHTAPASDEGTEWYRDRSIFRDCSELGDDAIDELIRRDGIDILTDLSGLMPEHRLQVFGRRAAPVQAVYPNCPTTTGVRSVGYIFTDRWTCPPGCEGWYTEHPVFLPGGYLAYQPPPYSPDVDPLPALRHGHVTFGVFQQLAKLNSHVVESIARVLLAVPGSRLLLFSSSRQLSRPAPRRSLRICQELEARGVDPQRIGVEEPRPHEESLALIGQVDIALDSFPFQGQTTTCESLWMGVPVIARSGPSHVARVGTGILQRAGLSELVGETQDEYVRLAVELAHDWRRLEALRSGMRARLRQSKLLDGRRLAREVEQAYRLMWQAWCSGDLSWQ